MSWYFGSVVLLTCWAWPVDRRYIIPSALLGIAVVFRSRHAQIVSACGTSQASRWRSNGDLSARRFARPTSSCVGKCFFGDVGRVYLLGYCYGIHEDLLHLLGVILGLRQLLVARLTVRFFTATSTVEKGFKDVGVVSLYLRWLLDRTAFVVLKSRGALVHDNSIGTWSSEEYVPWWYVIDPSSFRLFPKVEPLVVVLVECDAAAELDVG